MILNPKFEELNYKFLMVEMLILIRLK